MQKDTIFFDEKAVETSGFLSDINKKEPKEFLDNVFDALEQVNRERRIFNETLRTYYSDYIRNNSEYGFTERNEVKGLSELLTKTSEGLDKKWQISSKTVRNWFEYSEYSMTKQNSKIAFFQVAFALGLSRDETKIFFMKLFGGIPAFTRNPVDLIFEYCFANKKSFKDAVLMLENYEDIISSEYENAFQNAYSDENKKYSHFYASAMNCNGGSVSLFNYLVNSVEDEGQTEEFLRTNDLSSYLSSLIKDYENKNSAEISRKALEETAVSLVSSKGLQNKYIRRESKDNTRIKYWREGKGTPELTDSFSDRILMYALIKKLGLNKKQISDLILLSAHSKAKRFGGKGYNDESPIDSIKDYIETKKDPSLLAACAEDIEIFSCLYLGKKIDINSTKEDFLNTHGANSIESLFELESEDFINELIKIRLEFSVNNVRAKEQVLKYIKYLSETKSGEKFLMSALNNTHFAEYEDNAIGYSIKYDFWINTATKHLSDLTNSQDEVLTSSYFPWFWVSVTYGFGNKKRIADIFRNASVAALNEIDNEPWCKLNTGNKFYKDWLIKTRNIPYSELNKDSEYFKEGSIQFANFQEAVADSGFKENKEECEDISLIRNTVAKDTFIDYCDNEILDLYKKDLNSVLKKIENNENVENHKHFLCSAFKNMPSPSFVEGNHFEAGKGNMNTYEQLRSLLIFLHFFVFHKSKEKTFKDYRFEINTLLSECGFSKLYSKEPLDFVFLTCAQSDFPVKSFSVLWNLALNN